ARWPDTFEVTSRKRWPLVRVCAPTRGSTWSAVSGESGACSASGTTPSFIWIRWATAVLVASLLGSGRGLSHRDPSTLHRRPALRRQADLLFSACGPRPEADARGRRPVPAG